MPTRGSGSRKVLEKGKAAVSASRHVISRVCRHVHTLAAHDTLPVSSGNPRIRRCARPTLPFEVPYFRRETQTPTPRYTSFKRLTIRVTQYFSYCLQRADTHRHSTHPFSYATDFALRSASHLNSRTAPGLALPAQCGEARR